MRRIGFVTAGFLGGLFEDDVPAARELERRGCQVVPLVWNEAFDARELDALVLRSPWDWYHHRADFRRFLAGLHSSPCPVFNPPAMLERYADKTYFRHLHTLGVATVPTHFFSPQALEEVPHVLSERGWREAVLKPSFTANASGAHRFEVRRVHEVLGEARQYAVDSEWMLQPFLDDVVARGEWSVVFFGQRFSHAVRKRPKAGDFRVQPEHGGRSELLTPPVHVQAAAERIVQLAVPDALYARVDGVETAQSFLLMELEVVEPQLFFGLHPPAAAHFADALLASLG